MAFKKAERKRAFIKLALAGPSGSGKTFSALKIAKGLAGSGKIAVLDTEHGSASLYAGKSGMPDFDEESMGPPFTTEKYLKAMNAAIQAGYSVLILDSVSHQWMGEGGIIDRMDKEKMASGKDGSFNLWNKYTPEHERFKSAIVQAPIHIIATMRAKQEYVMTQNDKGKMQPQKMGMAPIQRDQFEYEFTAVLDLGMDHLAIASKDRTGLFDGKPAMPTEETGIDILNWLNEGAETEWKPTPDDVQKAVKERKGEWSNAQVTAYMKERFKKEKLGEFSRQEYDQLLSAIRLMAPAAAMTALTEGGHF